MITRFGAALVLMSGTLLALAGCNAVTSGNGSAAGGGSVPVRISMSFADGPSAPATSASVAAGQGGGGGAGGECALGQLGISLGTRLPPGAPGVSQRPIIFTNIGSTSCFVRGWPGVATLDATGAQAFQATRVNAAGPQITLRPGDRASAMLGTIAYHTSGGSSCATMPTLLVTPPNETRSARVAFNAPVCDAPTVTALGAGTNGGDTTQAASQLSEARQLWTAGATAISAEHGRYWTQAASLLINAVQSGAPGTTGFTKAAQELTQLTTLPDAMLTPAQQAQYNTLVDALDTFFNTPGLYH